MSYSAPEMPLFTKTQEFLNWLVPATNHFPRLHRHTVTRRLLDAALDFQEAIMEANSQRDAARLDYLIYADADLGKVQHYLRLAHGWHWLTPGQYQHASRMTVEMGKLLGGWQKQTRK